MKIENSPEQFDWTAQAPVPESLSPASERLKCSIEQRSWDGRSWYAFPNGRLTRQNGRLKEEKKGPLWQAARTGQAKEIWEITLPHKPVNSEFPVISSGIWFTIFLRRVFFFLESKKTHGNSMLRTVHFPNCQIRPREKLRQSGWRGGGDESAAKLLWPRLRYDYRACQIWSSSSKEREKRK